MRFNTSASVKLRDAFRARAEPEAARIVGSAYWAFLLSTLTLLICGGIAFGAWQFFQLPPEDGGAQATQGTKKIFTKASLQKALQVFDERAREYDRRKTAPVPLKDPS